MNHRLGDLNRNRTWKRPGIVIRNSTIKRKTQRVREKFANVLTICLDRIVSNISAQETKIAIDFELLPVIVLLEENDYVQR